MAALRLLLVSGSSLVGQNVLSALDGRRGEAEVVATGSVAPALAMFDFDAVHLVPETMSADFDRRLAEIVDTERPDLVIPCRDDEIVALARLRERRPDLAPRLLCGARAPAVEIADKFRSQDFAHRHGLPYVPSAATGPGADLDEFARAHGFPLVVKPRAGFASRGVVIVTDAAQLGRVAARAGQVVQPFLGDASAVAAYREEVAAGAVPLFHSFEGIKRAGQTMIAPDGSVVSLQCTRNTMRFGMSDRVVLDEDPEIVEITRACTDAAVADGWRGPFNVQCLPGRDGRLLVHEFNGRLTGASAAQTILGQDDVGLAILHFAGRGISPFRAPSPLPLPREVVKAHRPFAADPARTAAILRDGSWRR